MRQWKSPRVQNLVHVASLRSWAYQYHYVSRHSQNKLEQNYFAGITPFSRCLSVTFILLRLSCKGFQHVVIPYSTHRYLREGNTNRAKTFTLYRSNRKRSCRVCHCRRASFHDGGLGRQRQLLRLGQQRFVKTSASPSRFVKTTWMYTPNEKARATSPAPPDLILDLQHDEDISDASQLQTPAPPS